MDPRQVAQEEEYDFPYHYLPACSEGRFVQHRYWSWGYRYLGRLQVACDLLQEAGFDSLIDIGCGDGRALKEIAGVFPDRRLLGIDPSEKAVALARRMSPGLHFEQRDLLRSPPHGQFDVATLLEVIEHVLPADLPAFIAGVARVIRPGGRLVVTVPHINMKLIAKHYQHFSAESLRRLLAGEFTDLRFVPFDHISWFLRIFGKLMGGAGQHYVVTNAGLNRRLFAYYMKHCLYGADDGSCQRIACVARKPTT